MELSFVASSMKESDGVPAKFKGTLRVKVPSFVDRLEMQAEMAETAGAESGAAKNSMLLKAMAKLAVKVKPMILQVDVATADGLHAAKSADDLYDNGAFGDLVSELVVASLQGFAGN